MKIKLINKTGSSELLLFFNGWSMDDKPFRHLSAGIDILMFYDYSNLANIAEIAALVNSYKTVSISAWSLGVYAAAELLNGYDFGFQSATAINGTLSPIAPDNGIPPETFQATIDAWSEPAQKRFTRRECSAKYYEFFQKNAPERSVEDQKHELIELQKRILLEPEQGNIFKTAVISSGDKIFPPVNQHSAWAQQKIEVNEIDEPHYFFASLQRWEEVRDLGKT
ncbi:MAG: DUF452 family protein [Lentisphaerae bacterium]|nr:DUF452 family protein [Lentisphaerota bacterium]MCP4102440.1 DUF452 family protein [Lentisphaerota bacterium]